MNSVSNLIDESKPVCEYIPNMAVRMSGIDCTEDQLNIISQSYTVFTNPNVPIERILDASSYTRIDVERVSKILGYDISPISNGYILLVIN